MLLLNHRLIRIRLVTVFPYLIRMDFKSRPKRVTLCHPRIQFSEKHGDPWTIAARESRSCTKPRHDVQGVPSTIAVYTAWKRNPYGSPCPLISSIHGSLSSSLPSTFVVQLTPMLLHNDSMSTKRNLPSPSVVDKLAHVSFVLARAFI